MKHAISFVGTGNYQEATYFFKGMECRTSMFPEAVWKIFQPDKMTVFMTQAAEERYLSELKRRLDDLADSKWRPVRIPDGKNESEIWEIFETITQHVDEGESVIFDITHAFRSIPILAMISIVYLRSARGVALEHVVYGAWEATENNRTPVFDLTPFMKLLDWTNATEMFIRTGHGRDIANLLKSAHQVAYGTRSSDGLTPPRELKNVASDIEKISDALALVRSDEVMEYALRLKNRPERYRDEARAWAKPFSLLVDRIAENFVPFAGDDKDISRRLKTECSIIGWLIDKNQIVQAILLAREWIITYVISKLGEGDTHDSEYRECIKKKIYDAITGEDKLPVDGKLLEIWSRLGDLRNDVAHCGMRRSPKPSDTLIKGARQVYEDLRRFAEL
ncbi:MAG TPA: TIGR02221 family CRISPR-associated protein [Methanothrix sp.]|nr:TIGR02221 family CRISPR-associated protein [Methanothrix sp.]HOL44807.1 TIGR02221 family CRISPR-associated protein [Methanothrix sp.]